MSTKGPRIDDFFTTLSRYILKSVRDLQESCLVPEHGSERLVPTFTLPMSQERDLDRLLEGKHWKLTLI